MRRKERELIALLEREREKDHGSDGDDKSGER